MSVDRSNSSSQSGYGMPNSSQLPAQQGTNGGTSHVQNSRSAQNGIANTSEPPSVSMAEFMLSGGPVFRVFDDTIADGQPNAVENANNISRDQPTPTNLDRHLRDLSVEERQRWQERWQELAPANRILLPTLLIRNILLLQQAMSDLKATVGGLRVTPPPAISIIHQLMCNTRQTVQTPNATC
jgi:hypothetical protein